MKKVGILTFHRAINYGAVLQTYALCKTVDMFQASAEVIDYRCDVIENFYYKTISKSNTIKQNIKNVLFYKKQKARNQVFETFCNQYLSMDEEVLYPSDDKTNIDKKYDAFFVGSDQVWNYPCIGGDQTYLLDFVTDNSKKNSYAASLGKMTNEQIEAMDFEKYLDTFSNLSVRENEGVELVKRKTGKEVHMNLDPTLLLEKEEWEKIASTILINDYLLVYSVNLPQNVMEIARRKAKEKNLKIVVITLENKFSPKKGEIDMSSCSPNDFLSLFFHAKYVITNSFHGTVFSIIGQKPFLTVKNGKKGLDNSRLETLLDNLQLKERLIDAYQDNDWNIDYEQVSLRLNELKQDSLNYIRNIVQEL